MPPLFSDVHRTAKPRSNPTSYASWRSLLDGPHAVTIKTTKANSSGFEKRGELLVHILSTLSLWGPAFVIRYLSREGRFDGAFVRSVGEIHAEFGKLSRDSTESTPKAGGIACPSRRKTPHRNRYSRRIPNLVDGHSQDERTAIPFLGRHHHSCFGLECSCVRSRLRCSYLRHPALRIVQWFASCLISFLRYV